MNIHSVITAKHNIPVFDEMFNSSSILQRKYTNTLQVITH